MSEISLPAGAHVVIVTGSFGAGHDRAAAEIQRRLAQAGHHSTLIDIVDVMPWRWGQMLRWSYFAELRLLPRSWGAVLSALAPGSRTEQAVRRVLALAGSHLDPLTRDADLVITTHPFAAMALGRLRRLGRLRAPAVTYLTDASVHTMWVDPDIDLHLAWHEQAAREVRRLGGEALVIQPLLPEMAVAERVPTNPGYLPEVLIVGGSQGVGDLEATARDVLATGLAMPVVLCGHNERLRERLAGIPGVVAYGWRDDAAKLIARSACVIQNAGGFTSLEAIAAGTPVITYRTIPGHGFANAAALADLGLVPWAKTAAELPTVLWTALSCAQLTNPFRRPGVPQLLDLLVDPKVAA